MARSLIGGFEYNCFAKHISQYAECLAQSDSLVSRHRMRISTRLLTGQGASFSTQIDDRIDGKRCTPEPLGRSHCLILRMVADSEQHPAHWIMVGKVYPLDSARRVHHRLFNRLTLRENIVIAALAERR